MTLLPIIYTSVLLFAALMLIIIFFSYLAFKLKGEKLNPAMKYKNEIANYKSVELLKNLAPNYDSATPKKVHYHEQQYYYDDRNSQRSNEYKYSERKRFASHNIIKNKPTYSEDRMKILNEINYKDTSYKKRNRLDIHSNNISNVNMFSFYDND
ncbi:hypothetical protein ABRY23_07020 [Melioribacteraceae bacterium 4301-Me]|uniref:hypothetical protein n=1 Tax=Pyranulibacter aquaticus TaxID=3163344 RepID=UPI003596F3BC